MDIYAPEAETVEKVSNIRELAAKPVDRLADQDVEAACLCVRHHACKSFPKAACPTYRRVSVDGGLHPAVSLDVTAANLDLVIERCLPLMVGRVTSIDGHAEPRLVGSGRPRAGGPLAGTDGPAHSASSAGQPIGGASKSR